jgi:hypothetical protein
MRADLDGDNNEEILVFVLAFAQQGTYRAGIVERAKVNDGGLLAPVCHYREPALGLGQFGRARRTSAKSQLPSSRTLSRTHTASVGSRHSPLISARCKSLILLRRLRGA